MDKKKDTTEINSSEEQKKKKTIDEKIQDLKTKLKSAEQQKREMLQRKGVFIWRKIKPSFFQDERILYDLLEKEEKMEILIKKVEDTIQQLFPDYVKKEDNIHANTKSKHFKSS